MAAIGNTSFDIIVYDMILCDDNYGLGAYGIIENHREAG